MKKIKSTQLDESHLYYGDAIRIKLVPHKDTKLHNENTNVYKLEDGYLSLKDGIYYVAIISS